MKNKANHTHKRSSVKEKKNVRYIDGSKYLMGNKEFKSRIKHCICL